MKKLSLFLILMIASLTSCNNDDDDNNNTPPVVAQTFVFDGRTYNMLGSQGITEAKMENVTEIDGQSYDRSMININGLLGFTETASVSFDLYYKHGMPVAGTYDIHQEESQEDFYNDFLGTRDRGCSGWISQAANFNMSGNGTNAHNPMGTVKVIVNSPLNYTIQYNGNFRVYNDDGDFVRNAPTVVNVTGAVDLHNN